MENEIKLYAKTNEDSVITDIKTKDFTKHGEWVEIGTWHDRMYYESITNGDGIYLYELEDGEKILRPMNEIDDDIIAKNEAAEQDAIKAELKVMDKELSRPLEDLIDLLRDKGVIEDSEIPSYLAEKINDKKSKREKLG